MPQPLSKQRFRRAAICCLFLASAILDLGCGGPTGPRGFGPASFQFSIDGGPTISASSTGMFARVHSGTNFSGPVHLLVFEGANCVTDARLNVLIARQTPITPGAYVQNPLEQVSVEYTKGRSEDPGFAWFENRGGGAVIIDELTDDLVSGSFDLELEDARAFPRNTKRFRGTFHIPMRSVSTCASLIIG